MLIQTQELMLQKLPWHLWDLLAYYPNAEIALSAPNYDHIADAALTSNSPRMLAILGDSDGIDLRSDRATLEQLAGKAVHFLPEPPLQDLTDELWQTPWKILFFAGHSASHATGATGRIAVNPTESLAIDQLKYALRNAVQRGLRLAIFNSCDGLGLAREFADLQIPQLIVMRELVPDYVAQQFLKSFLTAFVAGQPLYQAVREARERLQGLETQFPCATWLPVIWQNPAAMPPTWQELMGTDAGHVARETHQTEEEGTRQSASRVPPQVKRLKVKRLRDVVRVVGMSTAIAISSAVGQGMGWLQPLELQAFDQLMRLRPILDGDVLPTYINDRLVLVGYTAKEVDDFSPTPYGLLPGVVIHAHMTSQLLSAVQDGQSLLWTWSRPMELLWLWGWAIASGLTMQRFSLSAAKYSIVHILLVTVVFCGGVCVLCYYCFVQGGWILLIPALLAIGITTLSVRLTRSHSFQTGSFSYPE